MKLMNNNRQHRAELSGTTAFAFGRLWILLFLPLLLYQFYSLITEYQITLSAIYALIPFGLIVFFSILIYIQKSIYYLIITQFVLLILTGYYEFPLGIYMLIYSMISILLLIIYNIYKQIDWTGYKNGMLLLYVIWGFFCLLEIGNPNHVQEAWNISITHYAFYPIICAILVPIAIKKTNQIEWLLIIWSLFLIISAIKGFWQKTYGFNQKEMNDLFQLGKAKTHIIWSGVRYFSFFTDAANYGVHMAMGATTLAISFFYTNKIYLRILFFIAIVAALYGMGISGTRTAMAVPVGAIFLYIILSKNKNGFLIGILALVSLLIFFRFTNIGQGNEYIRKMRSAFYATEDASYQVRVENREKIKALMTAKPFGYGIGLGGKAERFKPKELMPYPPDSWLVNVWTDTGIVGLALYLLIHIALFIWCSWILWFKISNKHLKGLLTAWLCTNAGYYLAAYGNDVMQYPNFIMIYTGFALCFAGVHIDKKLTEEEEENKKNIPIL